MLAELVFSDGVTRLMPKKTLDNPQDRKNQDIPRILPRFRSLLRMGESKKSKAANPSQVSRIREGCDIQTPMP